MCTAVLIGWAPATPPVLPQHTRPLLVSQDRRHHFVTPWLRRTLSYIHAPVSIEWFLEDRAFLRSYDSAPHSPPSSVRKLYLFPSLPLCRRWSLLTGQRWRGWPRVQIMLYDREKDWPSMKHSILSAMPPSLSASHNSLSRPSVVCIVSTAIHVLLPFPQNRPSLLLFHFSVTLLFYFYEIHCLVAHFFKGLSHELDWAFDDIIG